MGSMKVVDSVHFMYAPTHHMYDFLCSIEKMKIQQKVNIVW